MKPIRAFIAVDLGEEIRERVSELQRKLKKSHADVRWVKPRAMHLTLAFLGNVEPEKIDALTPALDQMLRDTEHFDLEAAGTGTFGKPAHPTIVWTGIAPNPRLIEARKKVVEALGVADIGFNDKKYSPHLTLGRIKSSAHIESLLQKLEWAGNVSFGHTTASEILLYRSVLKPSGAEHTVLHRAPLKLK